MNENHRLFYFLLFIILLLVMGVAYLARPANKAAPSVPAPAAAAVPQRGASSAPAADFTALLSPTGEGVPSARDIFNRPSAAAPARSVSYVPSVSYAPSSAVAAPAFRSAASVSGAGRKSVSRTPRASAFGPVYSAPRVSAFGSSAPSAGGASYSGWRQTAREEAEARADIFSPFTSAMTRREQTNLNRRLQDLSSSLERAIASAVMPKSKREENIEKYLARSRGESAVMDGGVYAAGQRQAGGAVQEVAQQLAAQARSIVEGVRGSYGDGAAAQAQSIMNDFQREMAETLNSDADPQEKYIKAQAVNNKYNEKLQELNNREALNKMAGELRAQNEEYLKKIEETYGPQTAAAMRPVLEDFANKRMEVRSTPLSEQEAVKRELALDEQLRKEQERIVKETAPQASAGNLTALQNELTKEQILEEWSKVEAGESFSPVFRESAEVREQNEAAWKKEGEAIVKGFEELGPEAVAEAQRQMDSLLAYRRQLRQQAQEKGLSEAEVTRLDMEATEKANEALQQTRRQGIENKLNSDYEQRFEQAPEDFKEQIRPVWEKYNKQRAALAAEVTDQQTYQARMRELANQEQQELMAAQAAYEAAHH